MCTYALLLNGTPGILCFNLEDAMAVETSNGEGFFSYLTKSTTPRDVYCDVMQQFTLSSPYSVFLRCSMILSFSLHTVMSALEKYSTATEPMT